MRPTTRYSIHDQEADVEVEPDDVHPVAEPLYFGDESLDREARCPANHSGRDESPDDRLGMLLG